MNQSFDYIIVGAGASGLLLANKMANDAYFNNKKILLIDREQKLLNDRTWCFWEDQHGLFDDILTKKWNQLLFKSNTVDLTTSILPYEYKMLRSKNFYKKMWDSLQNKDHLTIIFDEIKSVTQKKEVAEVITQNHLFTSSKVFNSILFDSDFKNQTKYPVLQQHFIGFFIKTKAINLDDQMATFMDFSIHQKGNTRFMYVLPYHKNEALFEYTLFSKDLLPKQEYEQEIINYLKEKGITDFEITETEQGSIPMTCYPFWKKNTKNIIQIGTAGGWSKASTGFTFKNINKQTTKLITYLKTNNSLIKFHQKSRFWFYDLLLLDILAKKNELGSAIFSSMFQNIPPQKILKFLDEETTFLEELSIFVKMPIRLFTKALLKRIF